MSKHPKQERTLILIKPDGVQRSLIGEIIKRFERAGLKICAIKMLVPDRSQAEGHYVLDPDWKQKVGEKSIGAYLERGEKPPTNNPLEIGEKILEMLVKYITAGPVTAVVLQGANAVSLVRKLVGSTEPLSSDVGTIRGDFVLDSYQMAESDGRAVRNIIHASGTVGEAEQEIDHWFKSEEICNYSIVQEKILYDVNLDGILE